MCSDGLQHPVTLEQCKHVVCKRCYEQNVNKRLTCGVCGVANGPLKGPQPDDGTADWGWGHFTEFELETAFKFPNGIQSV